MTVVDFKTAKKLLKKFFKQQPATTMKSLLQEPRKMYKDEALKEYGFLPDFLWQESDKEIEKYIYEEMWICICSPYDCTGELFTQWITFHRNPCGAISFVHCMGLDV